MDVTVVYGDSYGHPTAVQKWSSTVLTVTEGYLLDREWIDWSNPDDGIFFQRAFATTKDGSLYTFLGNDNAEDVIKEENSVCVFDRSDMDRAISVLVDGEQVLERAPVGEQADFDCGLRFHDDNKTPSKAETDDGAKDIARSVDAAEVENHAESDENQAE